jgi:hypothetical protein
MSVPEQNAQNLQNILQLAVKLIQQLPDVISGHLYIPHMRLERVDMVSSFIMKSLSFGFRRNILFLRANTDISLNVGSIDLDKLTSWETTPE